MNDDVRIPLRAMESHIGEQVVVEGRVDSRRATGTHVFLELRGLLGHPVQAVVSEQQVSEDAWKIARKATRESALAVEATVKADERAPGGVELNVLDITWIGASPDWPFSNATVGAERRIDDRHLYLRTKRMRALLRIRATLSQSIRAWLDHESFLAVDAPIFTPNIVEERSTLFKTARFQEMSFLTQSGQLYNEAAAGALGRVYSFGPAFRSEPRPTRRHLAEFWMVEPEMSGASLEDMLDISERFVRDIVTKVARTCEHDFAVIDRDVADFQPLQQPFERMPYTEAIKEARRRGIDISEGDDLSMEAEQALTRDRNIPLFVTHYPTSVKPFYMAVEEDDPTTARCADLLAPEGYGEILGGGERETDPKRLESRLREENMPVEHYQWYLDVRRYGPMPHAGFGMGLERAIAWICGLDAMDETIPFPRTPGRSSP